MNFAQINNFGASSFSVGNWNWNFSNNRNFLYNRSGNCKGSCNRHSMNMRNLNMMHISLLYIILHNGLSDDLIGRNSYIFSSISSVVLSGLDEVSELYSIVWLSVELYVYIFSLYNWLYKCVVENFSTWSCYSLHSCSFL